MKSGRRNPPAGAGWNTRYGLGQVSARAAIGARTVVPPLPVVRVAEAVGNGQSIERYAAGPDDATGLMDGLLGRLAEEANRSQSRIRITVEVEPVAGKGA